LLVGESANSAVTAKIRQLIRSDDSVVGVGELLTMQLGPDQVFLAVDIKFRNSLGVQELEATIDRLDDRIRTVEPTVQRIFIEAESLRSSAIGGESSGPKYAHTNR
jgi:divalent metal cation (Fe/Co/Zn/Cd) transporter